VLLPQRPDMGQVSTVNMDLVPRPQLAAKAAHPTSARNGVLLQEETDLPLYPATMLSAVAVTGQEIRSRSLGVVTVYPAPFAAAPKFES
jgi:hypothetical protein